MLFFSAINENSYESSNEISKSAKIGSRIRSR